MAISHDWEHPKTQSKLEEPGVPRWPNLPVDVASREFGGTNKILLETPLAAAPFCFHARDFVVESSSDFPKGRFEGFIVRVSGPLSVDQGDELRAFIKRDSDLPAYTWRAKEDIHVRAGDTKVLVVFSNAEAHPVGQIDPELNGWLVEGEALV